MEVLTKSLNKDFLTKYDINTIVSTFQLINTSKHFSEFVGDDSLTKIKQIE